MFLTRYVIKRLSAARKEMREARTKRDERWAEREQRSDNELYKEA